MLRPARRGYGPSSTWRTALGVGLRQQATSAARSARSHVQRSRGALTDTEGDGIYINPAYAAICGRPAEACLGRGWVDVIHPEDRARVAGEWYAAAQEGHVFSSTHRVLGCGDFATWVSVTASTVHDGEALLGYTDVVRDVTEERRIAEARAEAERLANEARQRAEAASRLKSEFLANMSHEIRTPMAAILGYAELLTEPDLAPERQQEHVATILRNGDHLLSLLNDILDLSKIEAGQMTTERISMSPGPLCEDVVALLSTKAAAKGVKLALELPAPLPDSIQSDPVRRPQQRADRAGGGGGGQEAQGLQEVAAEERAEVGEDQRPRAARR